MQEHPEYFTELGTNTQNKINNTYRVKEYVSAVYVRADFRLMENRLNVVTGARYERTSDTTKGPLKSKLLGLTSKGEYASVYPSLNAAYRLSDRFTLRLAYGAPNRPDPSRHEGYCNCARSPENFSGNVILQVAAIGAPVSTAAPRRAMRG